MKNAVALLTLAAALSAGCAQKKATPAPASDPNAYLRMLPVLERAGFSSKLYRLPGTDHSLALQDSTLFDLSGVDTVVIVPEPGAELFTVRMVVNAAGKRRAARMLPALQDRLVGIVVDGKLLSAPSVAEAAGEDTVTIMEHLSQEDAWTLASGIVGRLPAAPRPRF
jgi:hypothetical protein